MKRALLVLATVLPTVLLSVTNATAVAATSQLQQDTNQLQAAGVVSVVARTVNHGVATPAVAGVTVLGGKTVVSPNTHYRTGSVTKTFVSATILQMVGEGRLSLDDTVDHWLPGVITGNGNDGTKITIRELLQHTSGLFDYTEDPAILSTLSSADGFFANNTHQYAPLDLIHIALSHSPNFAPGTSLSYSNTGYVVLGQVIKAVTGNMWDVEVTNRIIKPLGLINTSIPATGVTGLPVPHADGYNVWSETNGKPVYTDTTQDDMSWADAAGKIITNTTDENTFFMALMTGKVLLPVQLAQMETTLPFTGKSSYGLGIIHMKICNTDMWWHSGGTVGYATIVGVTPDGQVSLAMDWATTDPTTAAPNFDGNIKAAVDVMVRHAFCGPNTASTDSISTEESALQSLPATP